MMQPMTTSAARGNPPFLGAEQRGDGHVRAVRNWPSVCTMIRLRRSFMHQHLVRLGQAELPGNAGVLDRSLRAGAGAAVVAADQDDVRLALGDARGDGADADFGHQLDADPRVAVGVLQVVDQLGQILDRIDVVVRRRRDQSHAGRAVTNAGDFLVDLVTGQLAAFAGLRAWAILICSSSALARYSLVTPNRPLATCLMALRAAVAVGVGREAGRVFAPLARVALAADAIHGDGQCLVRFLRDRAVRHRAGGEPLDDLLGRLDFVERHRLSRPT